MGKYNVYGLGNALMDIQAFVNEDFLKKYNLEKGIMSLIDENKSKEILSGLNSYKTNSQPGGDCANSMSTIALLGGKPVFNGVVADDMYGRLYDKMLADRGVKTVIYKIASGITGNSIVLTTPDAERTMNTHLGVCREYSREEIDIKILEESQIVHCTGYNWDTPDQKDAVKYVMDNAKHLGKRVSFDLADPFCVDRNGEDFRSIISKFVHIVFGNEKEAQMLTGENDPVKAGRAIRKMGAEIVLVKVGAEGSYLFYDDKEIKIAVCKADRVLDSTGCGDSYAGGFLYGITNGYTNEKSAKIASLVAGKMIEVPGAQFESLDFNNIKQKIKDL